VPEAQVLAAARQWVVALRRARPEIVRVAYFGSYARGDYVPGSDFDVLIEVSTSDCGDWRHRGDSYAPAGLPVGLNLFVYTTDELARLRVAGDGFLRTIEAELRPLS
jgi:hypothetical protein